MAHFKQKLTWSANIPNQNENSLWKALVTEREQFQTAGARRKCCEGTCGKEGSTVRSFSSALYPTAPRVKNAGTTAETRHAGSFQKWKQCFSKKNILKAKLAFSIEKPDLMLKILCPTAKCPNSAAQYPTTPPRTSRGWGTGLVRALERRWQLSHS